MCYLYPPLESPDFNEDSFSILEGEINHFQAQGHVLVCGNLNARTGQEPQKTWVYAFTMVNHENYTVINTLWKKKEQPVRNQLNVDEEPIDSNHF